MDVRRLQKVASPFLQVARGVDNLVTIQSIENANDALRESQRLRGLGTQEKGSSQDQRHLR